MQTLSIHVTQQELDLLVDEIDLNRDGGRFSLKAKASIFLGLPDTESFYEHRVRGGHVKTVPFQLHATGSQGCFQSEFP